MKAKKAIVIILSVILAVFLAYSTAATVTLCSEDEDGGFAAFSDALVRLYSDPFVLTAKKTLYRLFGVVADKNVKAGSDGYLFPVYGDGFDYASDINGQMRYDEDTKARFLYSLKARQKAYQNDGCELYVYVIPNSQTVLKDKLKTKSDEKTAAEDLEAFLHENGFENFRMLSDALTGREYDTYNNTENTVNGYGAYMIYRQIASNMPDGILRRCELMTLDGADITVSYSDGGALAKAAGIDKLIKNKNVTYPSAKFTSRYTSKIVSGLTVCRLKDEHNGFIGRSSVLFQIPDGERTLLMPLFSASYTDTVYNNSLAYSYTAYSNANPTVSVCIVREDRLSELLNDADIKTYETQNESGTDDPATKTPDVTAVSCKQSGHVFVAGECESGATVTVRSGTESVTVLCKDGIYIAELQAKKGDEIKIYADYPGKLRSDTVKCEAPSAATAEEGVFAGKYSTLYYGVTVADFTGSNKYKPEQLEQIKNRFEAVKEKICEASGKQTKIIFLSAPDPLSVYPEYATDRHYGKKADITRLDQFKETLSGIDGVTFLDIRETMRQNTDIDKLYYQTDTHWTETGAYFGYRAIAEAVGQEPYPLYALKPEEKSVSSGDLSSFAGLSGMTETVRFLTPEFRLKAAGVEDKPDTIDRSVYAGELESAVDDSGLPTAVMIRDSYSANLFPLICEHFGRLYCQSMWEYEPDYKKIAEIRPDYVIYVICERNIDNIRL